MLQNRSKGLLFYSDDRKPLPELVVALYSARKFIKEDIHVTLGPNTPKLFELELARERYEYNRLETKLFKTGRRSKIGHWFQKPFVIQQAPFDTTLYYDCDHLFMNEIPKEKWSEVESYGLSTGHDDGDPLQWRKYLKWISYINKVTQEQTFGRADHKCYSRMNGGCIGYAKNETGLERIKTWIWFLNAFHALPDNKRIVYVGDESSLSATINMAGSGWLGEHMSMTRHPYEETVTEIPDNVVAWHYARSQYKAPDLRKTLWLNTFREAWEENFLGLQTILEFYLTCNGSINRELVSEVLPCLR